MERFNLSEKDAEQTIWKDDKRRADNYHYYTNRMLGAAGNFDITLNTELGSDYIFSLPTSSPQSYSPSSIRSPLNSIARSSSDLCLLLVVNLSYKSTRHFPACSHNFPKAGEARFQGLSRLFRLLGKFPYLGESRRILMAVSSKTSSKTRFYYAATRRISSAAVQPSIWA